MGNKIWDFIGKTVYQVQIRGEIKVGFPVSWNMKRMRFLRETGHI